MTFQRPTRPLLAVASALATAGTALAVAGCSHVAPLGPESAPASFPPSRQLGSPITLQVMRSRPPTQAGQCPAGSVALLGSALVPRASPVTHSAGRPVHIKGSTTTAAPPSLVPRITVTPVATATATAPPATPGGVACFLPTGQPVTVTSAAVSSVVTFPPPSDQPGGPAVYGFAVAFPAADVPALTALIQQAYDSGDALGMSVAGKLWQAPKPDRKFIALRAEQINLLSRTQARQLYRLLIPAG
jgi:hypothetical protein